MNANTTNKHKIVYYPELSYKIVGICFSVHNELGNFMNEKQYADAIEEKFKQAGISYKRELILPKAFIGEAPKRNVVDFFVEDKIILELKTKRAVVKDDYYQLKRYLVSANKKLGILVNFRNKYLSPKRVLN